MTTGQQVGWAAGLQQNSLFPSLAATLAGLPCPAGLHPGAHGTASPETDIPLHTAGPQASAGASSRPCLRPSAACRPAERMRQAAAPPVAVDASRAQRAGQLPSREQRAGEHGRGRRAVHDPPAAAQAQHQGAQPHGAGAGATHGVEWGGAEATSRTPEAELGGWGGGYGEAEQPAEGAGVAAAAQHLHESHPHYGGGAHEAAGAAAEHPARSGKDAALARIRELQVGAVRLSLSLLCASALPAAPRCPCSPLRSCLLRLPSFNLPLRLSLGIFLADAVKCRRTKNIALSALVTPLSPLKAQHLRELEHAHPAEGGDGRPTRVQPPAGATSLAPFAGSSEEAAWGSGEGAASQPSYAHQGSGGLAAAEEGEAAGQAAEEQWGEEAAGEAAAARQDELSGSGWEADAEEYGGLQYATDGEAAAAEVPAGMSLNALSQRARAANGAAAAAAQAAHRAADASALAAEAAHRAAQQAQHAVSAAARCAVPAAPAACVCGGGMRCSCSLSFCQSLASQFTRLLTDAHRLPRWLLLLPPAHSCSAQSALRLHADDAVEAALKLATEAQAAATAAADQAAVAAAQVRRAFLLGLFFQGLVAVRKVYCEPCCRSCIPTLALGQLPAGLAPG